jgi:hypothetical protein
MEINAFWPRVRACALRTPVILRSITRNYWCEGKGKRRQASTIPLDNRGLQGYILRRWIWRENRSWRINPGEIVPQQLMTDTTNERGLLVNLLLM